MNTLGIDFGLSKVGLAYAAGPLAAPLRVIRYKKTIDLAREIGRIVLTDNISKIVIGLSDGEVGAASKEFGELLEKELGLPVVYADETLTTKDVQAMTIEAGMKRIKRRRMEDAFSATLILQNYLDNLVA